MASADLLLHTLRLNGPLAKGEGRDRWRRASTRGLHALVEYEACTPWVVRRLNDLNVFDALNADTRELLAGSARQIAANNLVVEATWWLWRLIDRR